MEVKVCGMKDPVNVEALQQLWINYIGFIFYEKSPRYVTLEGDAFTGFDKLKNQGVKKVGVFVDAEKEYVLAKAEEFKLDYVQLHGKENIFYCKDLKEKGLNIIKAFAIDNEFVFTQTQAYQYFCDYFLFDTKGKKPGGNGISFDWNVLNKYHGETPFFLSGGIGPDDLEAINQLRLLRLEGIDLNSGFEIEPGKKDVGKLKTFLDGLSHHESRDWGSDFY